MYAPQLYCRKWFVVFTSVIFGSDGRTDGQFQLLCHRDPTQIAFRTHVRIGRTNYVDQLDSISVCRYVILMQHLWRSADPTKDKTYARSIRSSDPHPATLYIRHVVYTCGSHWSGIYLPWTACVMNNRISIFCHRYPTLISVGTHARIRQINDLDQLDSISVCRYVMLVQHVWRSTYPSKEKTRAKSIRSFDSRRETWYMRHMQIALFRDLSALEGVRHKYWGSDLSDWSVRLV